MPRQAPFVVTLVAKDFSQPLYKKYVTKTKKYYAHDPNNNCNAGDVVNIEETKKTAAFIFREILILLSPFIPFITEEIWLNNSLDNSGKDHLMLSTLCY